MSNVQKLSPFIQKIVNMAYKMGEHNDPLKVVLTIALFKGINRPLFTMMDKHSDPEAKKYAAFREGLTEVAAATTYVLTNKLLVKPMTNFLHGKAPNVSHGKIEKAVEFFCVCLSAGLLIPAVCNAVLNPFMKFVGKFKKKKEPITKLDIKETVVPDVKPLSVCVDSNVPKGPNSLLTVLQNKANPYQSCGNMKVGV